MAYERLTRNHGRFDSVRRMPEHRITEPILHVDMDAFFVEVERLDDERLRGRPVVVGGVGRRGVVASASYEARAAGVYSAMPMGIARRLCPGLTVVPTRHERYGEISEQVFAVFEDFTPWVEGLSMDEAFLDIGGLRRHYRDATTVAEAIRARIRNRVGLPASVGAATTLYLAKMASGRAKPDGIHVIGEGTEQAFLQRLPVHELWGVGKATRKRLAAIGIETVGELGQVPLNLLRFHLGEASASRIHRLAHGVDERVVTPDTGAKSISVEQTYGNHIEGTEVLRTELLRHCDRVAWRLRRAGLSGRTVSLKIRLPDFTTVTRSETLPASTDVARDIYRVCGRLLDRSGLGEFPVRLLGVALSGLQRADAPRQLSVQGGEGWDDLSDTVDSIRLKFGRGAVVPAPLRTPGSETPDRVSAPGDGGL